MTTNTDNKITRYIQKNKDDFIHCTINLFSAIIMHNEIKSDNNDLINDVITEYINTLHVFRNVDNVYNTFEKSKPTSELYLLDDLLDKISTRYNVEVTGLTSLQTTSNESIVDYILSIALENAIKYTTDNVIFTVNKQYIIIENKHKEENNSNLLDIYKLDKNGRRMQSSGLAIIGNLCKYINWELSYEMTNSTFKLSIKLN